jgi:hypothetical protein
MRSWNALPNVPLRVAGPVTAEFIACGITNFQAAGRDRQGLPYGSESGGFLRRPSIRQRNV